MDDTVLPGVLLGEGRTATVHPWGAGRVVKLFREGYPRDAVEHEHACAAAVTGLGLPTPAVHGVVRHGARWGVVYDRVEGEPLDAWTLRTGDVARCAAVLAELHLAVGRCPAPPGLPGWREVVQGHLARADGLPPADVRAARESLDALPDGPWLCHGDLHPGNVLLTADGPQVVDLTNLCRGPASYDVARTVHLVRDTPLPAGTVDQESLRAVRAAVADAFVRAVGVPTDVLAPYLTVVRAARVGECPEEPRVV